MFGRSLTLGPAAASGQRIYSVRDRERLVRTLMQQAFGRALRDHDHARTGALADDAAVHDFLFAGSGEPRLPDEVFGRLRWGGVFAYVGTSETRVRRLAESFDGRRGFVLEQPPTYIWSAPLGLRLPGLATKGYWFSARKTQLIQPGQVTERFTYDVELARCPDAPEGWMVCKQVPTVESVLWRLQQKFPDADRDDLDKRAHKLVDHVFPTFLTREAAILKILQEKLPEPYRQRVPRALGVEKDGQGFVRRLAMNWLRTGGEPMSQLEFARQSAELLSVLHDMAGVIHLDLRLDNFVITEHGVGFVDFGSAVRMGEELERSPMLSTLFGEMMRTSQIQRMLGRMLEKGQVTNRVIREVHGKVDRVVDAFYLAVQINRPLRNPEFRDLIRYDPASDEARMLDALTAAVLRPKHPDKARFKTAADILRGIRRIQRRLEG